MDPSSSSPVAPTDSSASPSTDSSLCCTPGCGKPATLACPTCLSLSLPPSRFCSQACFKSSWKQHNADVHKPAKARLDYTPPPFDYTGPLRPHYVTPRRTVPDHIKKPDHADSGIPFQEMKLRGSTAIHVNSAAEVRGCREANRRGRLVLDYAHTLVKVGVTTEEIDRLVHLKCIELDCYPSPLNYHSFPKSCCTSVNEVICHGIPDARPLQDGDIVNVDISVFHDGFHGDLNETYCVGKVDADSRQLIRVTYDAMMQAIAMVKPGVMCRDFGDVITRHCQRHHLSVVKAYCGHGIGRLFHGAPNIPHYARNKAVGQLKAGMVFTIEPMVNAGTWKDVTWKDEWTSCTADGKRSAQFEHTVLVTETGYEILTARTKNSPPLWWEEEGGGERKDGGSGVDGEMKEQVEEVKM